MERAILEAIERKAKQHGIARFKVELGWAENLTDTYHIWIKFKKRPDAEARAVTKYIPLLEVRDMESFAVASVEMLLDDIWKEEKQK